jgi:hypothetical protein
MTARKAAPKRRAAARAVQPKPVRTTYATRASASQKAKPKRKATKAKPATKPKRATKAKPAAKPRRRKAAPKRGATPYDVAPAVAAVESDLSRMPPEVQESAEAATALAMASRLDSGDGSPSECAKALLAAMGKLREMTPPEERKGQLHAIRSGRADRLAEGSPAG